MNKSEIDNEKQRRLVQASLNLIKRIYEISPQESDGVLNYYISGSLITNILPLVKKMETMIIDKNTNDKVIDASDIEITPEIQEAFLDVVRPSRSGDIDVVMIGKDPYFCAVGKTTPHADAIKKGLEEDFKLVYPTRGNGGGDMMDRLESAEDMDKFHVAKVELVDGTELYMPSLESLLYFKYMEANALGKNKPEKIEDLRKLYEASSRVNSAFLSEFIDNMREKFEKLFVESKRDEKSNQEITENTSKTKKTEDQSDDFGDI